MKNHIITQGIVLARTDYQEADRILTVITPDHGKLRLIAKGVRRSRSKLAGGIELLSVSDITVLPGRGEINTLISARLVEHYGNIVQDIQRTMLAYSLLKKIDRITEDAAEEEYFNIIAKSLEGLNHPDLSMQLAELWFIVHMLDITGHAPNLVTDVAGQPLREDSAYVFDFENMAFAPSSGGPFQPAHIKLLRLATHLAAPIRLNRVQSAPEKTPPILALAQNLLSHQLNV